MTQYFAASLDHFLSAIFLGFLPVVLTTLLVGALVSAASRSFDHLPFSLSFAVLGASLGLLLGASREPVVQAFLPAIITLISGLLLVVFPRSDAAKHLAAKAPGVDEDAAVRNLILVGLAAMLLSSVTGAFWGGSVRSLREQDDRRYAEWLEMYQRVRLPLELEAARKSLGLTSE